MRKLLVFVVLSSGCTTIHSVAPGPSPGEFYAVASFAPIVSWLGTDYVLRCERIEVETRSVVACERVLSSEDAALLRPGGGDARKSFEAK